MKAHNQPLPAVVIALGLLLGALSLYASNLWCGTGVKTVVYLGSTYTCNDAPKCVEGAHRCKYLDEKVRVTCDGPNGATLSTELPKCKTY